MRLSISIDFSANSGGIRFSSFQFNNLAPFFCDPDMSLLLDIWLCFWAEKPLPHPHRNRKKADSVIYRTCSITAPVLFGVFTNTQINILLIWRPGAQPGAVAWVRTHLLYTAESRYRIQYFFLCVKRMGSVS